MTLRDDAPRSRSIHLPAMTFACVVALAVGCGDPSNGDATTDVGTGSTSGTSPTTAPETTAPVGTESSGAPSTTVTDTADPTTDTASTDTGSVDSSTGAEDPVEYAGAMNGYRWELPCADPSARDTCPWDPAVLEGAIEDPAYTLHRELQVAFGGDPATVYDVTIRIRGLAEPKNFTDGEVQQEHFQIGGTPTVDDYNIYGIDVTDPAQSYTVNRHETPHNHFVFVMDYTVTIPIRGGATVTMKMLDPNDVAIANPGGASGSADPYVVPEIPPFPDPFYGQFIQMDVVSVAAQ